MSPLFTAGGEKTSGVCWSKWQIKVMYGMASVLLSEVSFYMEVMGSNPRGRNSFIAYRNSDVTDAILQSVVGTKCVRKQQTAVVLCVRSSEKKICIECGSSPQLCKSQERIEV